MTQLSSKTSNNNNATESEQKSFMLKEYMRSLSNETKFKFWIKTLLSSYKTIPEILNTVDKIIELQATSVTFASDIFNKSKSALCQVEKVIDLTERKNSLLNIYIMINEMIKKLSERDREIIEKKYMFNWSAEELAREYSVSPRTIYRKLDKLIQEIYEYCTKHNWTLKLIELQVKDEGWLKEKYIKNISDYFKNSNYGQVKELY